MMFFVYIYLAPSLCLLYLHLLQEEFPLIFLVALSLDTVHGFVPAVIDVLCYLQPTLFPLDLHFVKHVTLGIITKT